MDPSIDSPLRRKQLDASNVNVSSGFDRDSYKQISAKEWEESLEEIVSLTNDNLVALERAKISAKGSESLLETDTSSRNNGGALLKLHNNNDRNKEIIHGNYVNTKSTFRPRAVSASKANFNSGAPKTSQSYDLWTALPKNDYSIEKKVDLLFKKYKIMEDKVKKNEKDNIVLQQIVNDNKSIIEKLSETNKTDKKVIYTMKEQFSNLKSRLEIILNNEEIRERLTSFSIPNHHNKSNNVIDKELITDLVSQKIREELPKVSSDLSRDMTKQFTKLSEKLNLDYRIFNKSLTNQSDGNLSTMEKEIIRLRSEVDRLKTRQSHLDGVYSELKEFVSNREKRADDLHRKTITSFKTEMDVLLETSKKILSDNTSHNNSLDSIVQQLQTKFEQHQTHCKDLINDLAIQGNVANQDRIALQHAVQVHELEIANLLTNTGDLKDNFDKFKSNNHNTFTELSDIIETQNKELSFHHDCISKLEVDVSSNNKLIEENVIPVNLLATAVESLENKVVAATKRIEENKEKIDEIDNTNSKIKLKVKQMSEYIHVISNLKIEIDKILLSINNKSKDDASFTYEFQSSLQKFDLRLKLLEDNQSNHQDISHIINNKYNHLEEQINLKFVEFKQFLRSVENKLTQDYRSISNINNNNNNNRDLMDEMRRIQQEVKDLQSQSPSPQQKREEGISEESKDPTTQSLLLSLSINHHDEEEEDLDCDILTLANINISQTNTTTLHHQKIDEKQQDDNDNDDDFSSQNTTATVSFCEFHEMMRDVTSNIQALESRLHDDDDKEEEEKVTIVPDLPFISSTIQQTYQQQQLSSSEEEVNRKNIESEERQRLFLSDLREKKMIHRRKFQKSVVMSKAKLFK